MTSNMSPIASTEAMALALGLGLGTLALRLVFGELRGKVSFHPRVLAALDWVPVAALAALVFPVLLPTASTGSVVDDLVGPLTAAMVTVLVAWKTRNLLWSVGLGMVTFWVIGLLF